MVEISLIPYKAKHFRLIQELHASNKAHFAETNKTLPKIGYIALLGNEPIACGFVRRLEPVFAQIDSLASNGSFGSAIRHAGIKLVVDALLEDCKQLKFQVITCWTNDKGITQRSIDHGFQVIPGIILAKSLK